MKKLVFVIVLLQLMVFANADDRIRNYNDQISFIFNLSNKFIINEMGIVEYPENSYMMYKITYNNSNALNNRRYLIISCNHGNEIAPVYAIKDFILYLDSKEQVINNITIDFIYILNPYGFEYNIRYNGQEKDLNRDFITVKTPEIKIFINSIKDTQYVGMYDFHEHGATKGFMLYYYANKNKELSKDILNMLKDNNIVLENEWVDVILKTKDGSIYVPFYAKWYYRSILKQETTGLYFDRLNVDEVFTFETPTYKNIEERKLIIDLILKYLFEYNIKNK
ncbi:hypothetical protein FACS189485_23390 [Spirochaetia bacterium]|nr:hypothetical protein FACS189485_23390 [Spirochaetia bacterium]